MKKSDNRGLFDIFKKGERDDLSFGEKLVFWFKNVYWCNYKGLTILGAFLILCACFIVVDLFGKEDFDLDYVIAGDIYMSDEQLAGVQDFIAENMTDANNDGEVTVTYQSLPVANEDNYDQVAATAEEKLFVSLANDKVLFYIIDESHMESLAEQGAFEPIKTFGIESENTYCIEITDSKIFRDLNVRSATGGWYIGVKVIDGGGRADDEEILRKYDGVGEVVKAFMLK